MAMIDKQGNVYPNAKEINDRINFRFSELDLQIESIVNRVQFIEQLSKQLSGQLLDIADVNYFKGEWEVGEQAKEPADHEY